MSTISGTPPVSKTALWTGRALGGVVILLLPFDGAIKLVPWPFVTETMDRIGAGSNENIARSLGFIMLACTVLYTVPPTSIIGAILLAGYLGGEIASYLRVGNLSFSYLLFGFYMGLMLWGGLGLRDGSLHRLIQSGR